MSQVGEGFQSLADDIHVRQLGFMGQNFPGRVEPAPGRAAHSQAHAGLVARFRSDAAGQPGFDVLEQALLGFEAFRHDHDRALWKQMAEQRAQKWLRAGNHAEARRKTTLLHAPSQLLNGGNALHSAKQAARDRPGRMCHRTAQSSQSAAEASSGVARTVGRSYFWRSPAPRSSLYSVFG